MVFIFKGCKILEISLSITSISPQNLIQVVVHVNILSELIFTSVEMSIEDDESRMSFHHLANLHEVPKAQFLSEFA